MTYFTCPHCGQRAATDREDLERIDVNGEPSWFIAMPPGTERHIDQRLCCSKCYERADDRRRDETGAKVGPHRFGTRFHSEVNLANPVGNK